MISGKSFSDRCTWVIDPRYPTRPGFQYGRAKSGEWVFLNGDYLATFLQQAPFLAVKRFVLVVHNTDRSFGQAELYALLPHAQHIYASNAIVEHPRLTRIPLGFVDRQLPFLSTFVAPQGERDIEIYQNFTTATNAPKRADCAAAFAGDPRVVRREGISVPEYYADLCRSRYVLCPEGTGIDTHRVYEALLCGATPVVLHGPLDPLYQRLPVCIVNNWTDPFTVPTGTVFSHRVAEYPYPSSRLV